MSTALRRAALLAVVVGLGATALATGAWQLLRSQALVARAAIGKPLGEGGYQVDRIYQRKRGRPLTLLVIADSIAAGPGADGRRRTLGVQLAKRLAHEADRSVRLVCAAAGLRPAGGRGAQRRLRRLAGRGGGADVHGPSAKMVAVDRFHPSGAGAGYRRTARAMLPSVLAALGLRRGVPAGHHPPIPPRDWVGEATASSL